MEKGRGEGNSGNISDSSRSPMGRGRRTFENITLLNKSASRISKASSSESKSRVTFLWYGRTPPTWPVSAAGSSAAASAAHSTVALPTWPLSAAAPPAPQQRPREMRSFYDCGADEWEERWQAGSWSNGIQQEFLLSAPWPWKAPSLLIIIQIIKKNCTNRCKYHLINHVKII